jgi:hypothetical protein
MWNVHFQSVQGRNTRITLYVVLTDQKEANQTKMQALNYCRATLGQPAEEKNGSYVWDAADGNVVLQSWATLAAVQTLDYCREKLAQPAELKSSLCQWYTADGNVVRHRSETLAECVVALVLNLHSISFESSSSRSGDSGLNGKS